MNKHLIGKKNMEGKLSQAVSTNKCTQSETYTRIQSSRLTELDKRVRDESGVFRMKKLNGIINNTGCAY